MEQRLPRPTDSLQGEHGSSSLIGCMAMILVGLMALAGLVALTLLSSGILTPALLAGAAFFAYALFHYFVWGWWLGGAIRREAEQDEGAQSAGEAERDHSRTDADSVKQS